MIYLNFVARRTELIVYSKNRRTCNENCCGIVIHTGNFKVCNIDWKFFAFCQVKDGHLNLKI